MADEIHYWSIGRLATALRAGDLSPVEATRLQLERISSLDPSLHAFVTVTPERALTRAAEAEREIAQGSYRGPLHGVPIAIKDLCFTKGVRTTAGTRVLRDFVPEVDAAVVERLERAGAIVLGKLAMTEGAFSAHHPDVDPPLNPWDAAHWTGISSSGSGVATAAGLCFASLGTDTGGSIRFPSACNGLVGIKPTYGRVPRHGVFPLCDTLDHVGPMARGVADAATLLGVIAGWDPRDASSLRAPVPDYANDLAGALTDDLDGDLRGLRIGVDPAFSMVDIDPAIAQLVAATEPVLAAAGAELREVRFPGTGEATQAWTRIAAVEVALAHAEHFAGRESDYGPQLRQMIELGHALPGTDYAAACQERVRFRASLEELFETVDCFLCPALGVALPANADLSSPDDPVRSALATRFTIPFDVSGSPTVTLPCGFHGSLPVGFQLVGRHLDETRVLRAAHAYEQATSWHARHPELP